MRTQSKAGRLAKEIHRHLHIGSGNVGVKEGLLAKARRGLIKLAAQRNKLLKALKDLERTTGAASGADDPVRVAARAAIKNAEAQT